MKTSIQINLEKIQETKYLSVPKERYNDKRLLGWFDQVSETPGSWLIPCKHTFYPPADETELAALTQAAPRLPAQIKALLTITNGAELFQIHYRPGQSDYWVSRYSLLSCLRLLQAKQAIWDTFQSNAEYDEQYRDLKDLDYLPFCQIEDGNYLAVSLEGQKVGAVFFLDHEYGFYPFENQSVREAYPVVARSFEEWLKELARTNGQSGLGTKWVPL